MAANARTPELHPAIQSWFRSRFSGLTVVQREALRHTTAGENTLIIAPTGSGKTLAAFLSALSNLAERAHAGVLPNAVCAIYVSPLKALGNDIRRNLEEPLAAVNAGLPEKHKIRMDVRTGDTGIPARGRQQRRRPHLLLTTPESLHTLLSQAGWRGSGMQTVTVIVDEIHALAENKRGSLLALALERLESRSMAPLQRIGLSATAWPLETVSRFLCGDRPCAIAAVDPVRAHRLGIVVPDADTSLAPAGYSPYRIAHRVAELVTNARCSLVFTSTRSAAERLALALKIILPEWDDKIEVHHASVDRGVRFDIEGGLARGEYKAVVCSSSLELGVDFSEVDQVILIGAPRGVSRTLQRLGRSGHRVDGIANGSLAPLNLPDLLECIALRRAARQGHLEVLRVPREPLDVLAQVLLAMSIERDWSIDDAFGIVRRAGPYRNLLREDFDEVIEYLAGGGKVLGPYGTYGKILVESGRFRVASPKAARAFYRNAGVISDDVQMKVVTTRNRSLGQVEENFLASLQPGEAFILGGKPVAVKRLFQNTAVVVPAEGEQVKTPRWMGGRMPMSSLLAREEKLLRQALRAAWEKGGETACLRMLRRAWDVPRDAAIRAAAFVARQNEAAPVPVDEPVQIELLTAKRTVLMIFHIVAGRAINRSLAWVVASRIGAGSSVVANFDDHAFLISLDMRRRPSMDRLREAFDPRGWTDDLGRALAATETLGRKFRGVAEIGQLIPRRTPRGEVSARASTWSASLLYSTLREHEPGHPLIREAVREALHDDCDEQNALAEASRIFQARWETCELVRPSPFALPLFAAFNRETLIAQEPDRALDDLVMDLYEQWGITK